MNLLKLYCEHNRWILLYNEEGQRATKDYDTCRVSTSSTLAPMVPEVRKLLNDNGVLCPDTVSFEIVDKNRGGWKKYKDDKFKALFFADLGKFRGNLETVKAYPTPKSTLLGMFKKRK